MVGKIIRSLTWCAVAVAVVSTGRGIAADYTWNGGTTGTWTTAANWLPSTNWSGSSANQDTATFLSGGATTVTVPNNTIYLNALTINRDLTLSGSSTIFSSGTAYAQAANTSVTIGFTNAGAAYRFSTSSGTTFNTLGANARLTVNVSSTFGTGNTVTTLNGGSLLTLGGALNASSGNVIYAGSGTVAYAATSGTSGGVKFYLNDTTTLAIKSTATATTGTAAALPIIAASGTNTIALERSFDLIAPVTSGTGGALVLGFSRNSATPANSLVTSAATTVTGPWTLGVNLLGVINSSSTALQKLVVDNGATVQVGDFTAGKAQGVSVVNTSLAYFQNAASSGTFQLDSASGGTLRVNADSSFNAATAASGSSSLGLGISVTGSATLVNNGAWTNRNFANTTILQGLSVAQTATLSGTGSFLMTSGNSGQTIGKSVAFDGTVAPGDIVSGVNGVGTLTINSGTVTFGSASKVAISGSGATLDQLVLNAPVSVTSGAKLDFAGTSNLTQGRYSLITGSSGLAGFASDNTPSAYRLALSATEAAIVARPVQSVGSLQIGSGLSRVMQGQSLAFTGTVSNSNASGGDALTVSLAQLAGSNLSLSGIVAAGSVSSASSQQISGTVATGSTLGARTWGLTNTDNIATVSTASGSATVNVLDNRTVTAGSVNFGLVRQNTTGSQSFSLTSSQPDSQYTRITVGSGSSGGFTVAGPGAFVFNGSGSGTGTLSGVFSTAGTLSGTIGLANASAESGGSLTGQAPGTTNVVYSASVFDGAGTWNLSSGGSWGSLASSNWTSTGNVAAAPGTFGAGYTTTDTATFGTAATGSSATVTIDTSAVSLASVVFNNATTRYVIAPGTGGGSFALAASGKPIVNVTGIHEIAAAIAGSSGLQKTGVGTLVLSGSSNYTGGTDVSAGTLFVNGAIGGAVNVANGATLGGSGSVAGLVTVLAGGTLSPGNSPGELTLGSLALSATSTTLMEMNGTVRGTSYDGITITGSNGLTYGGVLSLVFGNGSAFTDNTTFNLFSFTGSPAGSFSSVTSSGFYAGTWTNNNDGTFQLQKDSQTLTFSQATGAVVVVPEPGALALAGVGVIFTAWRLARRTHRGRSCSTQP